MPAAHPARNRARPQNQLLAQLPTDAVDRLAPRLTTVSVHARQVLIAQNEPVRHVYFPNGGLISIATVLSDGAVVEAATIGDEGLVGVDAFFSERPIAAAEAIVQIAPPDRALEMLPVDDFRRELDRRGALYDAVAEYARRLHAQVTRLTACNARHGVEARCARWLLTADDHMRGRDLRLSQEFLAVMLGVRRQTVSTVAGALQDAGLIQYTHGRITIRNRKGLQDVACECYPVMRALHSSNE